jgi:hypothetical protein
MQLSSILQKLAITFASEQPHRGQKRITHLQAPAKRSRQVDCRRGDKNHQEPGRNSSRAAHYRSSDLSSSLKYYKESLSSSVNKELNQKKSNLTHARAAPHPGLGVPRACPKQLCCARANRRIRQGWLATGRRRSNQVLPGAPARARNTGRRPSLGGELGTWRR